MFNLITGKKKRRKTLIGLLLKFWNTLSVIRFSDLIKSGTESVCHKKHGKQKWWKSLVETSYQHNAIIPKTKQNSLSNVLSSRTFLMFVLKCLKFEWPKQKSLPSFIRFFSQRQIIKYNFINETISFRKFKISHSSPSFSSVSSKSSDLYTNWEIEGAPSFFLANRHLTFIWSC